MAIATTYLNTTTTTVYTSSDRTVATFISLCNNSASTVTVSVYLVPYGDSPSDENIILDELEILAHDTYIVYQGGERIVFADGDYIEAIINSGSDEDVNAVVSYATGV